jgi:hypothetical protein
MLFKCFTSSISASHTSLQERLGQHIFLQVLLFYSDQVTVLSHPNALMMPSTHEMLNQKIIAGACF